jgi:hypothetical protein
MVGMKAQRAAPPDAAQIVPSCRSDKPHEHIIHQRQTDEKGAHAALVPSVARTRRRGTRFVCGTA